MNAREDYKAVHIAGGNYFDNLQIDVSESHRKISSLIPKKTSIKRLQYRNRIKLYLTRKALRYGFYEFLVVNGIIRKWFDDFQSYWSDVLKGRPLTYLDFFMLLHDYRKRIQYTTELVWNGPAQHLLNWQNPNQIFLTFLYTRKLALIPTEGANFLEKVTKGSRILEYGCGLSPYYYSYREFFSHLDCKWTLADIPNFPFHYAKYLYRNDAEADFVTIYEDDFPNPLGEISGFDVIIITTVFEHLDNPLFIAQYLLERLKPGGMLVFDYIKSSGEGLDHPNAVKMRQDCLRLILEKTEIIEGIVEDINQSVNWCVAKKK